ncbi:hypothetical protein A3Q56_06192 [Intoshia linei]|uniref:Uncharacterized protein n=1 Tax=Intoshia linei TaxID=1819745 RepID=A0A177AVM2_9BILA|nr:hypothetical protein A3Q56_06192 [Intoshia linei]
MQIVVLKLTVAQPLINNTLKANNGTLTEYPNKTIKLRALYAINSIHQKFYRKIFKKVVNQILQYDDGEQSIVYDKNEVYDEYGYPINKKVNGKPIYNVLGQFNERKNNDIIAVYKKLNRKRIALYRIKKKKILKLGTGISSSKLYNPNLNNHALKHEMKPLKFLENVSNLRYKTEYICRSLMNNGNEFIIKNSNALSFKSNRNDKLYMRDTGQSGPNVPMNSPKSTQSTPNPKAKVINSKFLTELNF